jgi:hypothetical protein
VPSPEERIEALAGAIEMLLQKHQRMQLAAVVLGATDSKSLDHPLREGDYRHARTMLTAGVFELATTIVNGGNEDGVRS